MDILPSNLFGMFYGFKDHLGSNDFLFYLSLIEDFIWGYRILFIFVKLSNFNNKLNITTGNIRNLIKPLITQLFKFIQYFI